MSDLADNVDVYTDIKGDFVGAAFYACDDPERLEHDNEDSAVEAYLGILDCGCVKLPMRCTHALLEVLPATVKVTAYRKRQPITLDPSQYVETALESLEEEGGDPDGEMADATPRMLEAAREFCRVMQEEYKAIVWACEPCGSATVNVEAWVRANAPEWLERDDATRSPEPAA